MLARSAAWLSGSVRHVEVVEPVGLEEVVAAVAVREPPDDVPVLDGAQGAGQDAADAAVAARRRSSCIR